MRAYRIVTDIKDLGIIKGDLYVQSPYDTERYHLARQPNRPPTDVSLIKQFIHLYEETHVLEYEIPALMSFWREFAQAQFDANILLIASLEEQKAFIDEQIERARRQADAVKVMISE
ncbi:hypothetical protein VPHF86_0188 [Vibrio phage F86]